jgi:nondiscriminating glutamyl-tRNA synthetase
VRVRTRFAPSPTGELHLGNARTAVLNWAFARHHDGDFVLRLEDTDLERSSGEAERRILEGLAWLGLDPDEGPEQGGDAGPYRQSQRGSLYRDHAERLLDRGRAYHCYCTEEELEARREAAEGGRLRYDGRCRGLSEEEEARLQSEGRRPAVRFRVEPGPVEFTDRVRGGVSIDAGEFGDPVILRSDGRPTYNFAVVVDDLLMGISHVIRGVGHLSNTPKQILLYRALDAEPPEFAHIPHVLAPGGDPLSKRAGARGLSSYREEGYHPDAVVNYLSLLAWSSESGDQVLDRERIVAEVDLDRVGRADAELDPEKMRWLSGRHIAAEAPERLAARLRPFLEEAGWELGEADRVRIAEVARDRIQLFPEAVADVSTVLPEPEIRGAAEALAGDAAPEVLRGLLRALEGCAGWTQQEVSGAVRRAREEAPVGGREFYHPLRAALTGALEGPELPAVVFMLGPERAAARLERGLGRAG